MRDTQRADDFVQGLRPGRDLMRKQWAQLYHASLDHLRELYAVEFNYGQTLATTFAIKDARELCVNLGHDEDRLPNVDPRSECLQAALDTIPEDE